MKPTKNGKEYAVGLLLSQRVPSRLTKTRCFDQSGSKTYAHFLAVMKQ